MSDKANYRTVGLSIVAGCIIIAGAIVYAPERSHEYKFEHCMEKIYELSGTAKGDDTNIDELTVKRCLDITKD